MRCIFKCEDIKELVCLLKCYKENSEITFKNSCFSHNQCKVYLLEELIYIIQTKESLNYPEYTHIKFNNPDSFNIDFYKLEEVFTKVAKTSSPDDTKHILQGIHFKGYNNTLECTATDGYRLNKLTFDGFKFDELIQFTIKFKTLSLVNHLMKGLIKVSISNNKEVIVFENDGIKITSCIQLGEYPNYPPLIPSYFDDSRLIIIFDKKTLLWNLKTAIEDNLIVLDITNNNADLKTIEVNTKIVLYNNVIYCQSTITHRVGFNNKFFKEAIQNIKSDKVTISLDSDHKKGALINQDNLTQLVMPTWIRDY